MSSQSLTYAVTVDASTTNVYSAGAFNNTNMMGNIIYINNEAMRVRKVSAINGSSTGDILEVTVDRAVFTGTPLEHAGTSEVQVALETNITVTGGGWEAGSYEFCHTVVDLQDNETLPQTPKSDLFAITSGAYFTGVKFRIKDAGTWRMNEKGVRVYTRKKDGNGRWILFLDVDYQRGVRKNLFEDYQALSQVDTLYHENSTAFDIVNPSLDTYESINGYSQDEESIDIGTGNATGTAVLTNGAVTSITIGGTNDSYSAAPTVSIDAPDFVATPARDEVEITVREGKASDFISFLAGEEGVGIRTGQRFVTAIGSITKGIY